MTAPAAQPLLSVRELRTTFRTGAGVARAVDGVSFSVQPHETLGTRGRVGVRKSVTSLSMMRLIRPAGPHRPGQRDRVRGARPGAAERARDAADPRQPDRHDLPGADDLAEPVFTVGDQIAEVARLHRACRDATRATRAVEMLRVVGIPDPGSACDSIRTSSRAACGSA